MKLSLFLTSVAGVSLVSAADCPAPGTTDSQGRYACNPAHQPADGQTCSSVDGCYFLTDAKSSISAPAVELASSDSGSTKSTCPDLDAADSQGRFGCNPSHSYPNGQKCSTIDGCHILTDADGKPVIDKPTSSDSTPKAAASVASGSSCPDLDAADSQGRFGCNPSHSYPNGQKCSAIDGCHILTGADGKPVTGKSTSSDSNPTLTPSSGSDQTTTIGAPQATGTPACPAPGSSDRKGRYSCNPAHQYPNGQKCSAIDGCYFLIDADGKPIISPNGTQGPPGTSGAASLSSAGVLALVGAMGAAVAALF